MQTKKRGAQIPPTGLSAGPKHRSTVKGKRLLKGKKASKIQDALQDHAKQMMERLNPLRGPL